MRLPERAKKYSQFIRFLVAGAFVVTVNLSILYFLTSIVGVYYLISNIVAFLVAFTISFFLQKSWTFNDRSRDLMHMQLPLYLGVQLVNLACNTALMYGFVEYLHIWYILSQAIISFCLAMAIFFVNKRWIFKPRAARQP